MVGAHAVLGRKQSERLKQEQQVLRQIMFVADQAFVERTEMPSVPDLCPPEARHRDRAEGGLVRPLPWEHLFGQAAE